MSMEGSPRQRSPQSMTAAAAPYASTRRWRRWRSPWQTTVGSGSDSSAAASSTPAMDGGACHRPSASSAAMRSRVCGTRIVMSARPNGSGGRSGTSESCSARRNSPNGRASAARWSADRPSGSEPARKRAPKNGQGNESAGRPTKTGAGTGNGSRCAKDDSARISRSTPGIASVRRGKRKTHCSSTSQTVLSQPSPISRSESSETAGNWAEIRRRANASSTVTSGAHSTIRQP
jgi:hypothetical protein